MTGVPMKRGRLYAQTHTQEGGLVHMKKAVCTPRRRLAQTLLSDSPVDTLVSDVRPQEL